MSPCWPQRLPCIQEDCTWAAFCCKYPGIEATNCSGSEKKMPALHYFLIPLVESKLPINCWPTNCLVSEPVGHKPSQVVGETKTLPCLIVLTQLGMIKRIWPIEVVIDNGFSFSGECLDFQPFFGFQWLVSTRDQISHQLTYLKNS